MKYNTIFLASLFVIFFFAGYISYDPLIEKFSSKLEEVKISNVKDYPQQAYITQSNDNSSEIQGEWVGLCNKDSIHSVDDFHEQVLNDPILREHFSNFSWSSAVVENLHQSTPVNVTLRKGNVILMSSKSIVLPKGDQVISDGKGRMVRTHCCNDVITPSNKVAMVKMKSLPTVEEVVNTYVPEEKINIASNNYIDKAPYIYYYNVSKTNETPEPATMLLFGIGLIGISTKLLRRNK